MKIAVVGKGGSGKSSISWLLTQYISQSKKVIAIDSDHNMDFANLLNYKFETYKSPNFKDSMDDMIYYLEYEDFKAKKIIHENLDFKRFFIDEIDHYSKKILVPINKNIYLGIVGLGADDVMDDGRCAHGMSNPLKVYLSLLDEGNSDVVVDGVAGVDMINFGLYHACDYLVIAVEPSRNSIRVAEQIAKLCDRSQVNYGMVVNKYSKNEYLQEIFDKFGDKIIGKILYDDGLFHYDYSKISDITKENIANIYESVKSSKGFSLVEKMMLLEKIKNKNIRNK